MEWQRVRSPNGSRQPTVLSIKMPRPWSTNRMHTIWSRSWSAWPEKSVPRVDSGVGRSRSGSWPAALLLAEPLGREWPSDERGYRNELLQHVELVVRAIGPRTVELRYVGVRRGPGVASIKAG